MTSNVARAITLLGATMTMGLAAGAFALYVHTIMPGLRSTDDRTFVSAFQAMDRAIVNPWFMTTAFMGALVLTSAAAISNRGTPAMAWIVAAGDPDHVNLALVRDAFHESRWVAWHLVRVATTVPAFGLLTRALVLYGRE